MHITVRGNDRQDIFHCDGDRLRFLACLEEAAAKNNLAVHAYVLMTNHVHMLVTGPRRESASKTIQSVGRRYVAYFNERYRRTGTLWEGRHRSTVVQTERYFFACHRYIDLNPVRAGLSSHPAEYQWSSYHFYALGRAETLLTPHAALLAMSGDEERRREAYVRMFDEALDEKTLAAIRTCSNKGWALGSIEFCDEIGAAGGRRAMPKARGWQKGRSRHKNLANEGV